LHRKSDLYVCFVHIPCENSTITQTLDHNVVNELCVDVLKFKAKGQVLMMGDFNGRVGKLTDYIQNDSADHIPTVQDDYIPDKPIKDRHFYDCKSDSRGREIRDLCICTKMRILNGRTLGDVLGNFTCFNKNGTTTIDKGIADESIIDDVCRDCHFPR
jgi:hypothetical protein